MPEMLIAEMSTVPTIVSVSPKVPFVPPLITSAAVMTRVPKMTKVSLPAPPKRLIAPKRPKEFTSADVASS